ncbi:Variant-specific surface protein, partial [Giardia duodenalis]
VVDVATALAAGLHRCSAGQFLFMGGCYDTRAAPESGVCREARDGACMMYREMGADEEYSVDGRRNKMQGSRAHDSMQGAERVKEATCADTSTHCETCNVQIGDSLYCSQCKAGFVPIDGKCTEAESAKIKCTNASGAAAKNVCEKCIGATFMYKGGCYDKADAPGNTICQTPGNTVGVCDTCKAGFFKSTSAAENKQSCIACNETETIDTFTGVPKCRACNTPSGAGAATCTVCEDGFFGAACTACDEQCTTCEGTNSESKCKSCKDGYFLGATNGAAGKCIQCSSKAEAGWPGVDNCAKCTSSKTSGTPATCTECAEGYYLKKDRSTTSCVADCGEGFFAATVDSIKKCARCNDKTSGGIADCGECSLVPSSAREGAAVTCTECTSNKLSPLGDACLAACPAGTYEATATTGSGKICALCHPSCAECNSNANQDSCTACYPGHVLNKTDSLNTGTCIPECTGRYAENCADGQCTAVLGGSRYCSKCKSGYVPVDGLCVSATRRAAPTGCISKEDGTCASCTSTYFLQSGGCYNTQTLPGKAVCTAVTASNNGQCQTCANGQNPTNGNCPVCAEGCAKCQRSTSTCTECLAGYYKTFASKCVKCSETSGNIQGVKNCISCEKPSSGNGAVTCYVKTDKGPNLSIGAIAGISVAVIVVVGGLVGLLCWWFVCHGKA